jgi:copper(I)-binding protein
VRRPPVLIAVAGVVAVVGLAGLIRGAVPPAAAGGGGTPSAPAAAPIVVTNAYVREPASPDVAAAYFTISNTTRSSASTLEPAKLPPCTTARWRK